MPFRNTSTAYGSLSKFLHWLTVLLICAVIPLGVAANGLAEQIRDPATVATAEDLARAFRLFSWHKTVGVAVFFVGVSRLAWTLAQPKPAPMYPDRHVETLAARTVHVLLLGSLVLVPLAGWISHAALPGFAPILWPLGQSLPFVTADEHLSRLFARLHRSLEILMVLALALHVAGALRHHFVDRDGTLRRMLPGDADLSAPMAPDKSMLPLVIAGAVWAAVIAAALVSGR